MIDANFVESLNACDFFAGNSEWFRKKVAGSNSVLVHGAHKNPPPLVSIIITTYKRPEWFKITLESALNQEGFDDYEIIIADNGGESLDIETETSRLVRSYNDAKIVYYRNVPSAYYRMDTAAALSRSKYFCIVHDDDFLSKHHLKLMTGILREHPGISYLACSNCAFTAKDEAARIAQSREDAAPPHRLLFYSKTSACTGLWLGWQGALINRERYINMGGMSLPIDNGISDFFMVFAYMDRYDGVHYAETKKPLYFYRISTSQASASGASHWFQAFTSEYTLYKYMARRYHPFFAFFWIHIASIIIHDKIRDLERRQLWLKGSPIDKAALERLVGLPARNARGLRRWATKRLLVCIRWYYLKKSLV